MTREDIQAIKQRFGIIGNSPALNRGIEIAMQVARTDLSVLVSGESGVGKEHFPQIIHSFSSRKHAPYCAVNCGAIPEGTIDSELFGHEKGAFTDARTERKGYFEIANGGTLFLDEVGELPLPMQAKLLRVLETGEFYRVGSSTPLKTNVRVVAATNNDLERSIREGRFREDLYYRLNAMEIKVPALRDRKEDIPLLFRKFAMDCSEKYRMPAVRLNEEATNLLMNYYWSGNVRQLKNIAERISVVETNHDITANTLRKYLPENERTSSCLAMGNWKEQSGDSFMNERELLYKVLFDMKKDINELKQQLASLSGNAATSQPCEPIEQQGTWLLNNAPQAQPTLQRTTNNVAAEDIQPVEISTIEDMEREQIRKALLRHNGNRKEAARELAISERTLYRKINQYDLNL